MLQPLFTSIVMVSFQTGASLFQAIESVLRQKPIFELVIVDNGNPDKTVARLRELEATNGSVKLITGHGNIGFGCANNMGVAVTRGDYVLLLNPDCILQDGVLEKLLSHVTFLSQPSMIGARIVNEDGSDQRGCRRELLTPTTALVEALHLGRLFPHWRLNKQDEKIPDKITPIPAISGAFMFMPRHAYDLINGFDEGYFLHVEDLDFCFRFRKAGGEVYFAPDVIATHIGGTSEVTSDFIESHKRKGFIRYFHQNFCDNCPLPLLWCLDIAIWARYLLRRLLNNMRIKQ